MSTSSPASASPPLSDLGPGSLHEPACYPPIDICFAAYPTAWIGDADRIKAADGWAARLKQLADDPLGKLGGPTPIDGGPIRRNEILERWIKTFRGRVTVGEAIQRFDQTIGDIEFRDASARQAAARITLARLIKFGILRCLASTTARSPDRRRGDHPIMTLVTTCRGRMADLRETLPRMAIQARCGVIVVDYDCPDQIGRHVVEAYPPETHPHITVVSVTDQTGFDRAAAKNAGIDAVRTTWTCLVDADVELSPDFAGHIVPMLRPGSFYRSSHIGEGTGGTFIAATEDLRAAGGHDPNFRGWGEEDDDLIDALRFMGRTERRFDAGLIRHRDHDDNLRVAHHDEARSHSHLVNRIYRCAKWDLARLIGEVPDTDQRRSLYEQVDMRVRRLLQDGRATEIRIDAGSGIWKQLGVECTRILTYRLDPTPDHPASTGPVPVEL